MKKRLLRGLYLLLGVCLFASFGVQAQISTTTFNNQTIKEHSIVVKYDNTSITARGKSVSPQTLAGAIRTEFNASIETTLERQNVEEWMVEGDLNSILARLNQIPGVTAFPNYVFQRADLEPVAIPEGGLPNQITAENAVDLPRHNTDLNTQFVVRPSELNSFNPINTVWEDDLNDSLRVDSTWWVANWASSGNLVWMLEDDGDSGYEFMVSNKEDTLSELFTEVYSPAIDMSAMDSSKSYRLRFDLTNYFADDYTSITLWSYSDSKGWASFDISFFDEFVWWDISEFVGDTVTFTWVAENYYGVYGGDIVAIDNVIIEEYPIDDALVELQWGLYNDGLFNPGYSVPGADVSAFDAWTMETGSDDVIIVVYDDGVDFSHEDLYESRWVNPGEDLNGDGFITEDEWNGVDDDGNGYVDDFWGWSAIYNDNSYLNPGSFHGTHVAGIIGAQGNNGLGISGVAQDVTMISVMIFDEYGYTSAIAIMAGYEYISAILANGVDVTAINQSWGGGGYLDLESDQQFVSVMTDYAMDHAEHDALWIISAGNDQYNRDDLPFYSYPNNIQSPNIITVASTDDADNLSWFSDFGTRTVDIGAPGSSIASAVPPSTTGLTYAYLSGTSMAAPHVAGAIALVQSMYPDETGHDLTARVLAGADILPQFVGVFGEGGRLNAYGALAGSDEGLVASHETATFHRTFVDGVSYEVIGFVNNSGGDVTVNSVAISGTDADAFSTDAISGVVVADGGAFGIAVDFFNDGAPGEHEALATISTTGGDVAINLNGLEQGFPAPYIDPSWADFGNVPYGESLSTSFTLYNDGNGDLLYNLFQTLYYFDLEFTGFVNNQKSFTPVQTNISKERTSISLESNVESVLATVNLAKGDGYTPTVYTVPENSTEDGPEEIYFEDFEDEDAVAEDWFVFDEGTSGMNWELFDLDESEDTNNVMFFGDFDLGYLDNSVTVAVSPQFDFSALEEGKGPSYLYFDTMVELEDYYDNFYVMAVVDGSVVAFVADTFDGTILNYGGYYTVYADIGYLAGLSGVEFWFVAETDGSVVDGFGALFDNVGIEIDDLPIYASTYFGEVAPLDNIEIEIGVNTDRFPGGDFVLETEIYTNGMISWYGNPPNYLVHSMYYNARYVNLELTPEFDYLGEVDATVPTEFSFDATNVGATDVEYFADVFIMEYYSTGAYYDGSFESNLNASLERFAESDKGESEGFNPASHRDIILENIGSRVGTKGQAKSIKAHPMTPTVQDLDIFAEDFEGGDFETNWDGYDLSYGLGSVWDIEDFGFSNVMNVGDVSDNGYFIFNDTYTLSFSPSFDLTGIPAEDGIYLEFVYSFLLEPGWDFGSVWIGTQDGDDIYLYYLGSSEDVFYNNGYYYGASIDLGRFEGMEDIFLAFLVETDNFIQSGWVDIDDINLYTADELAYISPKMGSIDSAATQTFDVTVNTPWLYPGYYSAVSMLDYFNDDLFIGRYGYQYTDFVIPNEAPVAEDDEIAVLSGDVVDIYDLLDLMLFNDFDVDSYFWFYEVFDPLYGDIKYLGDGPAYVAPLGFDGVDMMEYIITDGDGMDTAMVYISVAANPHFPVGSDKQFVFLEDESLTLSTVGMAAGVGGEDAELFVWGRKR